MSICRLYELPNLGDSRGSLVSVALPTGLPFEIRRVYYLFGTKPEVSRGFHTHKTLHQVAVCLSGSCMMVLDNGKNREDVLMDSPFRGVDLPPMIWHEMYDFSPDCVLLVLASDYYDESDYVRDYSDFKGMILG